MTAKVRYQKYRRILSDLRTAKFHLQFGYLTPHQLPEFACANFPNEPVPYGIDYTGMQQSKHRQMSRHFIETTDDQNFDLDNLSVQIYKIVCRTDFSQPGFALLRLPQKENSAGQRRTMVNLKERLSRLNYERRGLSLEWFNMTRFDQKNTTKPHRDGAPSDSLLILGYEPTSVKSKIIIADYSRCAYELGITPDEFLEDFNPMYEQGLEKLAPFTTEVREFEPAAFQILIINNSSNPFSETEAMWQGVLHSASVSNESAPRVINSTCVAPTGFSDVELVSPERVAEFLDMETVAGSYL